MNISKEFINRLAQETESRGKSRVRVYGRLEGNSKLYAIINELDYLEDNDDGDSTT